MRLAAFLDMLRTRIPLKPAHTDQLRTRRHVRFAHVEQRGPRRESFRQFWRTLDGHPAFRGRPRTHCRALARLWYRESKPNRQ